MSIPNLEEVKLLILEDDHSYIQDLVLMLNNIGIKEISTANSVDEAWSLYEDNTFDLMLLDIHLGIKKLTGDSFAREIRKYDKHIPILYLTSFFNEKIYTKVKDTNPSLFLGKELSKLELLQAIELTILRTANINSLAKLHYYKNQNFFFKIGHLYKSIYPSEILYFFAKDKMTFAKVGDRSLPISSFLKNLEEELIEEGFIRAHKAYLVNMNAIKHVNLKDGLLQIGEEQIPIGNTYRKILIAHLKLLR